MSESGKTLSVERCAAQGGHLRKRFAVRTGAPYVRWARVTGPWTVRPAEGNEGTAMRVIAGSERGRRLKSVRHLKVRPTADRVREGLFSILSSRFDLHDAVVLDLFAGTGALGIEALSRGARRAVFVERGRGALHVLRENVELCGFPLRAEIWPLSVRRALRGLEEHAYRFDGVLMDPPYESALVSSTLEMIAQSALLRPGAWVIAERHVDEPVSDSYGPLRLTRDRRYGKTSIVLYSLSPLDSTTTGF
jgi:16S rRNA (guanine966-N2)-methyltransferase